MYLTLVLKFINLPLTTLYLIIEKPWLSATSRSGNPYLASCTILHHPVSYFIFSLSYHQKPGLSLASIMDNPYLTSCPILHYLILFHFIFSSSFDQKPGLSVASGPGNPNSTLVLSHIILSFIHLPHLVPFYLFFILSWETWIICRIKIWHFSSVNL